MTVRRIDHGYDFLGYFVLPGRIYPRRSTVNRMINRKALNADTIKNFNGYFSFAKSYNFIKKII